jgi:hypothetical protein
MTNKYVVLDNGYFNVFVLWNNKAVVYCCNHSSQQVRIKGGGIPPFRPKMRDPPTLSSEALLGEKITKNGRKRQKIEKYANSSSKAPKIGSNGLFERFWRVSPPLKTKKAQNTQYYIIYLTNIFSLTSSKIGTPPPPFA